MNLTRNAFIAKLREIGPGAWQLYTIMVTYAEGDRCRISRRQMVDLLGVSITTIDDRLRTLRNTGLIEANRQGAYSLNVPTGFNVVADSEDNEPNEEPIETKNESAKWNTTSVMSMWKQLYKNTYGTTYTPANWAKEMSHVKLLTNRYDQATLTRIIEVVFRLYAKRWASNRFPRPTIGQLASWLASQANALASSDQPKQPITEAQNDLTIGKSLEQMMDEKGWI